MSLYVNDIFKGNTTLEDIQSKPGLIQEMRGSLVALAAIDDKHSWRLESTRMEKERVTVFSATEEVTPLTVTKKYVFQMEVPASEWPSYTSSSNFKTFQTTPLGYGNLESLARGGKKPATYKKTTILCELDDGDTSIDSITKVIHTTGHREKDKEPVWERVDMFHCAVVFKGISVLIQVPLVYPQVPVRKGIHRDRTINVLVAKDEDSCSNRVVVEHMCITKIPNRMRFIPRKMMHKFGKDRVAEISAVVQHSNRKTYRTELGVLPSTATPSMIESAAKEKSPLLGPERTKKYIAVLNKCYSYLESLATERTSTWTCTLDGPSHSMFSQEYRAARREGRRTSDTDENSSYKRGSFSMPGNPIGRKHSMSSNVLGVMLPSTPSFMPKTMSANQDSFTAGHDLHSPRTMSPKGHGHDDKLPISRSIFYHKSLHAPPLYGVDCAFRAEFLVHKLTPDQVARMFNSKVFWLAFEPIRYSQVVSSSIRPSVKFEGCKEIVLNISDSHAPDWIAIQKVSKQPSGAIQISVMNDAMVTCLIEGRVLISEDSAYHDEYYLTVLCEPRGRHDCLVTCVTMINRDEVGNASRNFIKSFKKAAHACFEEEKASKGTLPCCNTQDLPVPLQVFVNILLAPFACLSENH